MIFFKYINNKIIQHIFGNIPSICSNLYFLLERCRDFKGQTHFSVCFSKAFLKGEYENLACSIICVRSEGSIYSPVRYSYLLIFLMIKPIFLLLLNIILHFFIFLIFLFLLVIDIL